MSFPTFGATLAVLLAAGILVCAITLGFLGARAARRAGRRNRHGRSSDLFRLLGGRLAGSVTVSTLRRAARETEAISFWDAIEAITFTLRRRERRELARSLERNRHVVAERRALADDAPFRRELAACRLALLPSRRCHRTLRRALVRGPESVTFAAARALAAHRDLPTLRWIYAHPAALSRRPIASLSGLLRGFGPRSRAVLIAALDHGVAEPRLECATLDALGVSRCRSALGAIEARLADPRTEVRISAARALGRLGMDEAIPALLAALDDPAWPARAQSAQALGRLRATPAIEALSRRVSDRAWWVRRHAAYALAAIGPDGRDALCELAARSPDGYAREMAREALEHGPGDRQQA